MTAPRFTKVNTRYDVGPDHEMLYVHIIVPKDRATALKGKLNVLLGWFMARNRILGINNKVEKHSPAEYTPKVTNGLRGRPKATPDYSSGLITSDEAAPNQCDGDD